MDISLDFVITSLKFFRARRAPRSASRSKSNERGGMTAHIPIFLKIRKIGMEHSPFRRGADDRGRTCTPRHKNLNLACLPVPSHPRNITYLVYHMSALNVKH